VVRPARDEATTGEDDFSISAMGAWATATGGLRYRLGMHKQTSALCCPRLHVLGYTRVSTTEQASSGLGLAAQEDAIRRECEHRGHHLVDLIQDAGASGKDVDRPGLQHALTRIARGEAQGLVVAKLDRLTRSTVDLAHLLAWLKDAGAALVALDLGLDTSTPTGKMVVGVVGQIAEWEREIISARTREAASVRRNRGERTGRPGVRDSAPALATRIRGLRESGSTWQAIADALNDEGVPTVRGGTEWRVSAVQSAAGYVRPAPRRKTAKLPELTRRRKHSN
jgi:DNA invertase Pin-like site-specific DNA recombinase